MILFHYNYVSIEELKGITEFIPIFFQPLFLSRSLEHKDEVGFQMWIDIKAQLTKHERSPLKYKKVVKLEFNNCHLKIEENLFYDEKLLHLEELIFKHPGDIRFSEGSFNTLGKLVIIFRAGSFRPQYDKNTFNPHIRKVIVEDIHFYDFSSDFFFGLGDDSDIEIRNSEITREPDAISSKEIHIRKFLANNVTLHPSNSVKPLLRLTGLDQASFANLNWNFGTNIFKNRGIIFKSTKSLTFENCTLTEFRAISGGVQTVTFLR